MDTKTEDGKSMTLTRPFNPTLSPSRGDTSKDMTIKRPFNPTQAGRAMTLTILFNDPNFTSYKTLSIILNDFILSVDYVA